MKLVLIALALALTGCASNKVSVTDKGQTAGGIARCSVMVGDAMVDKEYCLTYESAHCQVQAGDCIILK
jgi:hypothetical protein